ncbi:hypothetical protein A8E22_05745 [Burkholderia cenocepacia]|nr:hypothetical protein A8E17_20775 [Burkholderia cenocepacia]ONR76064.1 hypothetical protein A8E18_08280 [Burkholderia cenocepacia]ONR86378.1 hypothetical protein A8E22_05745 [Burkholderia cenocepacia]ONR97458.1 hypothetical protein A8E19_09120 [Burkholderia cenocepacia]
MRPNTSVGRASGSRCFTARSWGTGSSRATTTSDLPPANRASRSLVKFVFGEEDEHEEALYGTANHRVSEGSRGRYAGQGTVQEARVQ